MLRIKRSIQAQYNTQVCLSSFFSSLYFYPYLQVNIDQMLAVAKKAEEDAEKQAKTQMDMMKELEKQAQSQVGDYRPSL